MNDLLRSPGAVGVLLSNDKIFRDESVQKLIEANALDLSVYGSIDDFLEFLKGKMAEYVRRDWDEDARTAAASLYTQKDAVETFIRESLNRSPAMLRPYFKKEAFEVRAVELQEVGGVFTPQPRESQTKGTVQIAASISCLVRIGPPKGATDFEEFMFGGELRTGVPIDLEADAVRRESRYEVTKLVKARPRYEPPVLDAKSA